VLNYAVITLYPNLHYASSFMYMLYANCGTVTSIGIRNTDIRPQQKAPPSLHYYSNQLSLCHFPNSHFHSYKHPTFMQDFKFLQQHD